MKKAVALAVVAAIASVGLLAGCSSNNEAAKKVDPVEFSEVIAQPGVIILDVRTPEEFNAGHIANAININVADSNFSSEVSKLDKNATIAVYCRSANRSAVATNEMADLGFTDMYDMQGGIIDWEAAGGPVVN
jgi:rhodanese-related sulfurtransferase